MQPYQIVLAAVFLPLAIFLTIFNAEFKLWLQARLSNAPVSFLTLIGLRRQPVDTQLVVFANIRAVKMGVSVPFERLIALHRFGVDVKEYVTALGMAGRGGFDGAELIGVEGQVVRKVDPDGAVNLDGEEVEVVTSGPVIPEGARVKVAGVWDSMIVVSPAE